MTTPAFWNRLWLFGLAVLGAAIYLLSVVGCANPHATVPPSTAAVRAPVAAAQVQVRRAVAIGKREHALAAVAVSKGIAPGSEEARELSTLTLAHALADTAAGDQLTAALYQTGTLQRELDARQRAFDTLTQHDKIVTARVGTLTTLLHRWKLAVLLLLVGDYFAGAPIQRGLRAVVSLGWRIGVGLVKHLIAFWPVLVALL